MIQKNNGKELSQGKTFRKKIKINNNKSECHLFMIKKGCHLFPVEFYLIFKTYIGIINHKLYILNNILLLPSKLTATSCLLRDKLLKQILTLIKI